MQNLIVLGLIPGTQIQISFGVWLLLFIAYSAASLYYLKKQQVRYWLKFLRIAIDVRVFHPLK